MSSPFQKQFSSKSPLHGAYSSGADAMVTVSDAGHFAKLQSDITGATLAAMQPKVSKCEALRNNWHADKMTDKAYADASKDCGETKDESSKTEQEKGIEKFGQDSYISNKMEGIGDLATETLENELKNK
jgi:hypothetical protein